MNMKTENMKELNLRKKDITNIKKLASELLHIHSKIKRYTQPNLINTSETMSELIEFKRRQLNGGTYEMVVDNIRPTIEASYKIDRYMVKTHTGNDELLYLVSNLVEGTLEFTDKCSLLGLNQKQVEQTFGKRKDVTLWELYHGPGAPEMPIRHHKENKETKRIDTFNQTSLWARTWSRIKSFTKRILQYSPVNNIS